jgi:glyoxylase-like metal-dependent hydrolase (beta-lactamase superfamily II)
LTWQPILPGVWCFPDSCNVYAIAGEGGCVVINAGTGRWLAHRQALPAPVVAVLCTHFFRDHSAVAAAQVGIAIHVPEHEREAFADPLQHFRQRTTYIIYDNQWDLFAPIQGVPVAGLLRDHDTVRLAGLTLQVVPLPGVTIGQVGLSVRLPGVAGEVVFCGEAIASPGRVARLAPLQYNYNDLPGAINVWESAGVLRARRPAALLPSLGTPMLADTDAALAALQDSMRRLLAGRPGCLDALDQLQSPAIERVTDHVWRSRHAVATSWFLVSKSGKVLAIDYGYRAPWPIMNWATYAQPANRRPLLHSLDGLQQELGIDRIDTVLVSHFHDDHVSGIPQLQRLYGTQAWVCDTFADLLERPDAHCFPCDWHQPIRVDRRLAVDERVRWEEYEFFFAAMDGHTRFSSLIGFEADGRRFAHTGDQYFFTDWTPGARYDRFDDKQRMQNHVYRNGATLDGYDRSGRWLLQWRPDIVLQGHQPTFFTDAAFFDHIEQWSREYRDLHRGAMHLGDDEAHFNLDSWGGWIWPYRVHLPSPRAVEVTVTVRNPLPRAATLQVTLVGPPGWQGTTAQWRAQARAEIAGRLTITPTGPCRRQPIAVDLTADGQPFGQVAEALVTVGSDAW